MRNVGALAQFDRQQYPPVKTPAVHQRERPLTLNPLLDPALEFCLLPIEGPGWYDYSHNGYHGTLVGAAWNNLGRYGPAMAMSNAGAHTTHTVALNCDFVAGDFTLEMWIHPLNFVVNSIALSRGLWNTDGWQLWIDPTARTQLGTMQAAFTQWSWGANGSLTALHWNHIIVTRVGANAAHYVNGVDVTAVVGPHANPLATPATLLRVSVWAGQGIDAYVDLVRIYSRALQPQEIADLYEQGRPGEF